MKITYGESLIYQILTGIQLGFNLSNQFNEKTLFDFLKQGSNIEPIWIPKIEAEAFAVSRFIKENNLIEKANKVGKKIIKDFKQKGNIS